MAFTPLKFIYDESFYNKFLAKLKLVIPSLNINEFKAKVFDADWDKRELKDRMKHTCFVMNDFLDNDFAKASQQIIDCIKLLDAKDFKYAGLAFMFFPDYIETYGINHFDISMKAFESVTPFTSCEFAVRPFIIQNPNKAFNILTKWSLNENYHIRRLASEGCRPKLPWAMALKELQKDPSPILPILENLKNDAEDYVYRSVANNLNDISKDHPDLVLQIAKKWKGKTKNTDWLVKHSLRTLLKAGNQKAMLLFGYGKAKDISISDFKLINNTVNIGNYLEFEFTLSNQVKALNRLEYAIYFLRLNGEQGKKVFKISEKEYATNSKTKIEKRHSFKIISTRKYHQGTHRVSIIVNGTEKEILDFELK